MQKIDNDISGKSVEKSFFSSTKNKVLIAVGIVVLLFAVLWIWKTLEINNLKKEHNKRETSLQLQANALLKQTNYRYLKLLAKPYAWAVRTEMMKGNLETVNLYAMDMIKEKNFQTISVVNEKNMVISSTNKKLEGKLYVNTESLPLLNSDTTIVNQATNGTINVSTPIMGLNKRIGTLLFNYMPTITELK